MYCECTGWIFRMQIATRVPVVMRVYKITGQKCKHVNTVQFSFVIVYYF